MRTLNTFVGDNDMEIELSPDFTFLLDLLVLGSGIAPGIAAITILQPVRESLHHLLTILHACICVLVAHSDVMH